MLLKMERLERYEQIMVLNTPQTSSKSSVETKQEFTLPETPQQNEVA